MCFLVVCQIESEFCSDQFDPSGWLRLVWGNEEISFLAFYEDCSTLTGCMYGLNRYNIYLPT